MKSHLFFWSITAALAGFLFGFDTVVISGAEQAIQTLWGLSPAAHGIAMASALYGTVLGSLLGGWPTDRFGRRATLLWIGILYLVSAVWSAFATDVTSFSIARFIGGVGVGISTVAAPLYIAEIAPPEKRGRLACMFQFNIVFGILVAFMSNALLGGVGEHAWRWMLGVEAFPALLYSVLCLSLPESPRWLIARRGDRAAGAGGPAADQSRGARRGDRRGRGHHCRQCRRAQGAATAGSGVGGCGCRSCSRSWWPFSISFRVSTRFSISRRAFSRWTGLGASAALLQSVGIGVTNLIFTFVGLWLIDRLGRRTLLYIGSFGYIAFAGIGGVGVFHATFRDRARLHLCVHRGACGWSGRGDLGVDLGDLPESASGGGTGAGKFHALVFRGGAHIVLSEDGGRV